MELQQVSIEQAKILKDLGFPQDLPMYDELKIIKGKIQCIAINKYRVGKEIMYAPSLELTAKWLRDEKNIHLVIQKDIVDQWSCWGHEISPVEYTVVERIGGYTSYEEALSAGIDKVLEVISSNTK